jgi:L-lactate dehydrogenase complex protein LldE
LTKVALFPTCVVDAVAPEVGFATARVLSRRGCDVSVAERTTCCGQPAWNSGFTQPAAMVARTTLAGIEEALEDNDVVVVPAGSCATMIKVFWPELFEIERDAEAARRARAVADRVVELSTFLRSRNEEEPQPAFSEGAVRYHPSCHMLRELGIKDEPCDALRDAGYEVDRGPERCCGFGGMFSVKLPETSVAMADDVLDAALEAGATDVVAADSSCLMQLRTRAEARGLTLRFRHLAVALDDVGS